MNRSETLWQPPQTRVKIVKCQPGSQLFFGCKEYVFLFVFLAMMTSVNGNDDFLCTELCLFRWKTFYKDSFPHFPLFGSIKKAWSTENYL